MGWAEVKQPSAAAARAAAWAEAVQEAAEAVAATAVAPEAAEAAGRPSSCSCSERIR
jgi:hypothetical protein